MIIVIEGCDQAGKKTQATLLYKQFQNHNLDSKILNFPDYSTIIGKEIQKYFNHKRKFQFQTIHCLLSANRWEKINEIKKYTDKNKILIINRYFQSNLIYGLANGIKLEWLQNLDNGLPKPDLVILLDIDPTRSFLRKTRNRDKFEQNKKFVLRISKLYRFFAKKLHWNIIDGNLTKNEVHALIIKILKSKQIL